jgi:hypothetical protein
MPADDALLFIDANKYLDLYRTDKGKKLLAPLGEQVEYIFVTQQIVDEVQRNKINVAANFLNQKFQELKLQTFNVPDHLSGANTGQDKTILQQMSAIRQTIKSVNDEVDAFAIGIMGQISSSEDEVSKALSPIFANAISHSPDELQKARDRRELGNPPGKSSNPIGDQLTWEQILTHFKGKKRLWIISRDGDYGTVYGGKGFLNQFLYDELCKVSSDPVVYLFQDTVEGISHFVETTGVTAENRLTPEDAEEIEKEEKSLPYLAQPSEEMHRTIAELTRPNNALSQTMAELTRPNNVLSRTMAELAKSNNDALSRTMAELTRPNNVLSRTMAELAKSNNDALSQTMAELARPNSALSQTMAELTRPNNVLSRTMAELAKSNNDAFDALSRTMAELAKSNNDALSQTMAELAKPNNQLNHEINRLFRHPDIPHQSLPGDPAQKTNNHPPTLPPSSHKDDNKE